MEGKSRRSESNPDGEWKIVKQRLSWEVLDTFAKAAGEVGSVVRFYFENMVRSREGGFDYALYC